MQKSIACVTKNYPSARLPVNWAKVPPRSTNTWRCRNFPRRLLANVCPASSIRIEIISVNAGKRVVEMHASCGVKSGREAIPVPTGRYLAGHMNDANLLLRPPRESIWK